jgi:HPr kinase/phosphorylase
LAERRGEGGPTITARALLEDRALGVRLRLLAGDAGLERRICHARIQKPGLALVGHFHGVVADAGADPGGDRARPTWLTLDGGGAGQRARRASSRSSFSLVVVTDRRRARSCPHLTEAADPRTTSPLAASPLRSSHTIAALHVALDGRLAPRTVVHGVLIDVFGQGILLAGKSGIGKSECAPGADPARAPAGGRRRGALRLAAAGG